MLLTVGSSFGRRLARKFSRVTASVPLKDETKLPIVLSILVCKLCLSCAVATAFSHAYNRTSKTRGSDGAISIRGEISSTVTKTSAPWGRLTRLTSVSRASFEVSLELSQLMIWSFEVLEDEYLLTNTTTQRQDGVSC